MEDWDKNLLKAHKVKELNIFIKKFYELERDADPLDAIKRSGLIGKLIQLNRDLEPAERDITAREAADLVVEFYNAKMGNDLTVEVEKKVTEKIPELAKLINDEMTKAKRD
ncbi:MAG TPA: hypothetical protein VLH19_04750 [Patescibacteria group bacterium]|nr:hypothetical protein [Patescibacteria group bacterium]